MFDVLVDDCGLSNIIASYSCPFSPYQTFIPIIQLDTWMNNLSFVAASYTSRQNLIKLHLERMNLFSAL
jgi:hypothetical protein